MITLGIESTAHTFGVGIVRDGEIIANTKSMYSPEKGGIHPGEASEHHYANAVNTIKNALQNANLEKEEIDSIAFSQGPGIPQCLQIGGVAARSLSVSLGIPLVGVNHCVAHIEIGKKEANLDDPVTLYVAGGNSQVIGSAGGKYRVFGETLDIAIGNALDKVARKLGIPHPGGPEIEKLAEKGDKFIELPYVVKGMDFSYSGLVTKVQRELNKHEKEDLCYSFQEHAFAMLVEATERAMAHLGKDEVLLTGGVAANKRLNEMLEIMAEDRGAVARKSPMKYCMDNGAMIAYTGQKLLKSGEKTKFENSETRPDWRTEQVDIPWL